LYAAANDDTLLDWQYPDEDRYLRAYARFRMILAYAAMGEPGSARAVYDAL
ncbi:MAG: hypothetical protein GWO02_17065, partial [Gammaproteobacteria bacterium]|nr:hypothetical protein [Gammaproteobacteria bacterium]